MADLDTAYQHLINGTIVKGVNEGYQATVGVWFWPLIFIFTLVLVYIKTENPSALLIYSIIGNFTLYNLIPVEAQPIFYATAVFSLTAVMAKIFISKKTE